MMTLSLVILAINIGLLIGGTYVVYKARGMVLENISNIERYFTPTSEGQPSDFDKLVGQLGQNISSQVGDTVGMHLKASIGGSMKGVTSELTEEAISANPALAIMGNMPKSIKKNPLAFMAMQAIINRGLPGPGGPPGLRSPENGNGVKFSL